MVFGTDRKLDDAFSGQAGKASGPLLSLTEVAEAVVKTRLEAIMVIDESGTIRFANSAVLDIFGHDPQELLGQNVMVLMPNPHRDAHRGYVANYLATGNPRVIGTGRDVDGLHKDGSLVPVELSVVQTRINGKIHFVGTLRDAHERKVAERFALLNDRINRSINSALDRFILGNQYTKDELFDELLSNLIGNTESEFGFIGEIMHDTSGTPYLKTHAITNIAWNKETRKFYQEQVEEGLEFRNLNTLFGVTIRSGEIVLANDAPKDPRRGGLPPGHPIIDTYLGLPIYAGNKFVGMAGIANRKDGYSKETVSLIRPFLATIGSIIAGYQNMDMRKRAEQELYVAQERLRQMATKDMLTGILNRAALIENLESALQHSCEFNSTFSVLFIDADRFKKINDEFGHKAGDLVLVEIASRVRNTLRPADILGRFGGEEFVIGLPDCDEDGAALLADRIRQVVANRPITFPDGSELNVSISIGVACRDSRTETHDDLLIRADHALYQAKDNGRNCVVKASESAEEQSETSVRSVERKTA